MPYLVHPKPVAPICHECMALHTQRRYAYFPAERFSHPRVLTLLTTRYVLCGFADGLCWSWSCTHLFCTDLTIGNLAGYFLFSNLFLVKPVYCTVLLSTNQTCFCFTCAHLNIRLHRCLASGGWAGLSTTRRSFCSPTHPPLTKTTCV